MGSVCPRNKRRRKSTEGKLASVSLSSQRKFITEKFDDGGNGRMSRGSVAYCYVPEWVTHRRTVGEKWPRRVSPTHGQPRKYPRVCGNWLGPRLGTLTSISRRTRLEDDVLIGRLAGPCNCLRNSFVMRVNRMQMLLCISLFIRSNVPRDSLSRYCKQPWTLATSFLDDFTE